MSYEAFFSHSYSDNAAADGARQLFVELRKRARRQGLGANFYFCQDQRPEEDWRKNITQAIEAPTLVVIIGTGYFSSAYCFFEWLAYQSFWDHQTTALQNPGFGNVFVLNASNVEPRNFKVDADALLRSVEDVFGSRGQDADRRLWATLGSDFDLGTSAARLRDKARHWAGEINLRTVVTLDESSWHEGKAAFDILKAIQDANESWEKFKESSRKYDPKLKRNLQHAASLSLLCLGFDQFHDGGWGFSLEDNYFEDDDWQSLATGCDEINLLVSRSLKKILGESPFIEQLEPLANRLKDETRRSFDATDRKQRLARGLLYLSGKNALWADPESILEEILSNETDRWIVKKPDDADDASVFRYILCRRVSQRVDNEASSKAIIKPKLDKFKTDLDGLGRALKKQTNELRVRLTATKICSAETVLELLESQGPDNQRGMRRVLQMSLLVSDAHFTQTNNKDLLTNWRTIAVDRAKRLETSELVLLCLILSDIVHHVGGTNLTSQFKEELRALERAFLEIWTEVQRRLSGQDALGTIASMNAIGWAGFLLLCEYQQLPTCDHFNPAWDRGLGLRSSLREKIGQMARERKLSKDVLRKSLEEMTCAAAKEIAPGNAEADLINFSRKLLGQGVLAHEQDTETSPGTRSPFAYVGLLEIEEVPAAATNSDSPADSGASKQEHELRIRSSDSGYNKLFLGPFTARTGLRADNLDRMMRYIGGEDDALISNISDVVVEGCFVVDGQKLLRVNFKERTERVRNDVRANPGQTLQDILVLRGSLEGDAVFVRRSATYSTESGSTPRKFYRWIFSDMTTEWHLANYEKLEAQQT